MRCCIHPCGSPRCCFQSALLADLVLGGRGSLGGFPWRKRRKLNHIGLCAAGARIRPAALIQPGHAQDPCGDGGALVCKRGHTQQGRVVRGCRGDECAACAPSLAVRPQGKIPPIACFFVWRHSGRTYIILPRLTYRFWSVNPSADLGSNAFKKAQHL